MAISHGVSGYTQGCRCDTCRQEWRDYRRQYEREWRRGNGSPRTVPADEARDIIHRLVAYGVPQKDTATAIGLDQRQVSRIARGEARRTHRRYVEALRRFLEVVRTRGNGTLICEECGVPAAEHDLRTRCYPD